MYKELLKQNPGCALTGSHALILQGFKLKKEPGDIDIYDTDGKFKIIEGMSKPKADAEIEEEKYADELQPDWTRDRYLLDKTKVDVFQSNVEKMKIVTVQGVRCVHYLDIIKAKMSYIHKDSPTRFKHLSDVLYFLIANN